MPPRSNRFAAAALAILALALALTGAPARADGVSVSLTGGMSTFHLEVGEKTYDRDGGFGYELRPQIGLEFPSLNCAATVFYQGRFGSNIGSFPISRMGGGFLYYPAGMPLQRTVLDVGVVVNSNRFVPFIVMQLDLANIAVTDSSQQSFSALTIGYQLGAGGELPVTQMLSLTTQLLMDRTLSGGGSGSAATAVSLTAYGLLLGVTAHL